MVEIDRVDLGKKIKISSMYFCNFVIISIFEKGVDLRLNKLESPSLKDALCQSWFEIVQLFWRSKILKKGKVFDNNDADDRTGSGELKNDCTGKTLRVLSCI